MKVYALFCGEYSERRLMGIYSTLKQAKKVYAKREKVGYCTFDNGAIEEVILDAEQRHFWRDCIVHELLSEEDK